MTICDNCIHRNVCADEGHYDEGLSFCADKIEERPTGHWKASGFIYSRRYAWCTCSNCGKTTRIYLYDNDFCCISDIRKKAIACLYCGADMREEADNVSSCDTV